MNRRKFVVGAVASTCVATTAGVGWVSVDVGKSPLTISAVLGQLDNMRVKQLTTVGDWSLSKILNHCAQSVEYSMFGFPKHKSDLFKKTLGSLAFSAFVAKNKMRHDLADEIPGAPLLASKSDLNAAYDRFGRSLRDFSSHRGLLYEHFAFGGLSKTEYEQAHAMHFFNHLEEIRFKANPL